MAKSKGVVPSTIGSFKNRIKEFKYIEGTEIVGNPKNWHSHGAEQTSLFRNVLAEIGFADALLVRELEDGRYSLLDGHLRMGVVGSSGKVPALILDVTEAEGDKILASLDSLMLLADINNEQFQALLSENLFDNQTIRDDLAGVMALLDVQTNLLPSSITVSEVTPPAPSLVEATAEYNPSFGFKVSVIVETPEARDTLIHLLEESGYTAEIDIVR